MHILYSIENTAHFKKIYFSNWHFLLFVCQSGVKKRQRPDSQEANHAIKKHIKINAYNTGSIGYMHGMAARNNSR